ncbi:MAG: cell wall hydrolase [Alphaproteobacteria bacterium]|nr:cell wall hydrolase [Alphaproteobacteria bacterium]
MNRDIEIMAKTIYGEARGEYARANGGMNALIAIGNVIMNRSLEAEVSIADVCLRPRQFSCWNRDDPNSRLLERVTMDNPMYRICYVIATRIICGEIDDITNGASHYYSRSLKIPPYWARHKTPLATIGNHIFFKLPYRQ